MKNILKNSMIAMLAIFAVSCNVDDVEDRPVVAGIDAPVLSAPEEGNVYALNADNVDALAERFVWSQATFGEGVIPNYDVEIDFAGENFDTPVVIGTTAGTLQLAVSNNVLNNAVLALGAVPTETANYEVRIKAHVGSSALYSNVVEMIITPYQGFVPLKHLYLMGTAVEYGFNNNNGNAPLFRDATNQNLFYFRGYFSAGEIKLIENLGAWQPQYGSAGDGILAINAGGGSDPDPIVVPLAGYYDLTVNIEEMTYSLLSFDASTSPSFASVGIIGTSTPGGWENDTDMTKSTANTHLWRLNNVAITAAAVKFRANDSWDLPGNWGGGTPVSGITSVNGSDFVAVDVDGTYDVWFNDLDGRYIFIPR